MTVQQAKRAAAVTVWAHHNYNSGRPPTRISAPEGSVSLTSSTLSNNTLSCYDSSASAIIEADVSNSSFYVKHGSSTNALQVRISGTSATVNDLKNSGSYTLSVSGSKIYVDNEEYQIS